MISFILSYTIKDLLFIELNTIKTKKFLKLYNLCFLKTTNDYITIRNTAYTDATAFKQAMQGVMLYYELATPIITDISPLIPDDFLQNLTVEAGGSVTFKGGNDDDRIPVPIEEEYIVKLSEIGGTT